MTQEPSLVGLFVAPLNRAAIEYMVTGGLAAIAYGHPRFTADVDLVLKLPPRAGDRFESLWPPDEFYCPSAEVINEESGRPAHGHFNLMHKHSGLRADVYLAGADELNAWSFEHRTVLQVGGEAVQFAPIEAVIVSKLRYFQMGGSERHLRDIARMMEVSGSAVDRATLDDWIARFNLGAEWAKARAFEGRE